MPGGLLECSQTWLPCSDATTLTGYVLLTTMLKIEDGEVVLQFTGNRNSEMFITFI